MSTNDQGSVFSMHKPQGASNQQIATQLVIQLVTVERGPVEEQVVIIVEAERVIPFPPQADTKES